MSKQLSTLSIVCQFCTKTKLSMHTSQWQWRYQLCRSIMSSVTVGNTLWKSSPCGKWTRNRRALHLRYYCRRYSEEPEPPHVPVSSKSKRRVHGVELVDEFEWMEYPAYKDNLEDYLEQEMRFTEKVLNTSSSLQKKLFTEMQRSSARVKPLDPYFKKTSHFEYWRETQVDGSFLYLRKPINKGDQEYILDVSQLLIKYKYPLDSTVSDVKVSPCEQYAACMVENSTNPEVYITHVVKLGDTIGENIDVIPGTIRFEFGRNGLIFYSEASSSDSLRASQVWRHQIGQSYLQDCLLYQESDDRFFVDLYPTRDGQYISLISSTTQTKSEVWLIDAMQDPSKDVVLPRLVWPRQDNLVYLVEHKDGILYVLANFGDDWQVYKVPVENIPCDPSSNIETIYKTSFEKVGGIEIIGDYCIVSVLDWTEGPKLAVKSLKEPGKSQQDIKLGSSICAMNDVSNINLSPDELYFSLSSPIQPIMYYSFHPASSTITKLLGQEENKEMTQFACVRTECVAKDGTNIPITLVHRNDLALDGNNPLLLHVYGAYGESLEMENSTEITPLVERGWVIAYCHVRGGGELGKKWADDGRQLRKQNTFEDFESCILHLHKMKYSQPKLTAALGNSAGGLPVAVICNKSPHLMNAAILEVPFVDVLSTMLDPSQHLTSQDYEEYGDPLKEQVMFDAIKEYCPYYNIKSQHYPSLYVTTALRDKRVPPEIPIKYVAKMRRSVQRYRYSSSTNDSPLIVSMVHDDRGHFASLDEAKHFDEISTAYAFLFQAMGLPQK